MRGYFAIGIENTKDTFNVGSLWRTADLFEAAFIFTIDRCYKTQASDMMKSARRVPLFHYADFDDFLGHLPYDYVAWVKAAADAKPKRYRVTGEAVPQYHAEEIEE